MKDLWSRKIEEKDDQCAQKNEPPKYEDVQKSFQNNQEMNKLGFLKKKNSTYLVKIVKLSTCQ